MLAPTGGVLNLGFGYTICIKGLFTVAKVTLSGLKLRVVRAYIGLKVVLLVLVTIRIGWLQGLCFKLLNKNVVVKSD